MDIRDIGARPPPPGRVASQAPAATPAASGSDDELPLSALRRKPAEAAEAAVTGTKRPRAALPTAPPRGPAPAASAAVKPGSSRLPPSASQPLRDRLAKAMRGRWRQPCVA